MERSFVTVGKTALVKILIDKGHGLYRCIPALISKFVGDQQLERRRDLEEEVTALTSTPCIVLALPGRGIAGIGEGTNHFHMVKAAGLAVAMSAAVSADEVSYLSAFDHEVGELRDRGFRCGLSSANLVGVKRKLCDEGCRVACQGEGVEGGCSDGDRHAEHDPESTADCDDDCAESTKSCTDSFDGSGWEDEAEKDDEEEDEEDQPQVEGDDDDPEKGEGSAGPCEKALVPKAPAYPPLCSTTISGAVLFRPVTELRYTQRTYREQFRDDRLTVSKLVAELVAGMHNLMTASWLPLDVVLVDRGVSCTCHSINNRRLVALKRASEQLGEALVVPIAIQATFKSEEAARSLLKHWSSTSNGKTIKRRRLQAQPEDSLQEDA
eukprot:TRINITY_DN17354_c0_g1_i3.p1 TRINITY_DN17354_c0_g1~~TRINITY_DN17354_c0_g1_i3.p1  ORF type:complete len:400 (-),score=96.03 TRINITY_DN17354_c0_g1_i3:118-1260(-)